MYDMHFITSLYVRFAKTNTELITLLPIFDDTEVIWIAFLVRR